MKTMAMITIEICPHEPRASVAIWVKESHEEHLLDCTRSGDAQPACEYVRDQIGVVFNIVARNDYNGLYENRYATRQEIQDTCKAIYFDSDADFSDDDTCAMYLIWEAANNLAHEIEEELI